MNTQTLTIVTTATTFPTIHIMTLNSLIVTKSIKSFLNLILLIGHCTFSGPTKHFQVQLIGFFLLDHMSIIPYTTLSCYYKKCTEIQIHLFST